MIPVVINNRNWLSTTKNMVEHLLKLGYSNIHILDNSSTYSPLLEYYNSLADNLHVTVHYMGQNIGHQALWKYGILNMFKNHQYIAYTDSDIELNPDTPTGFIETLITLVKDYRAEKAGLAIQYLDIPHNKGNDASRRIEERYWTKQLLHPKYEVYDAYIDTTFAVVKTDSTYAWSHKAVRVAGDFTSRHTPWYIDWNNLTEEQQYYFDHADTKFCSYKRLMK